MGIPPWIGGFVGLGWAPGQNVSILLSRFKAMSCSITMQVLAESRSPLSVWERSGLKWRALVHPKEGWRACLRQRERLWLVVVLHRSTEMGRGLICLPFLHSSRGLRTLKKGWPNSGYLEPFFHVVVHLFQPPVPLEDRRSLVHWTNSVNWMFEIQNPYWYYYEVRNVCCTIFLASSRIRPHLMYYCRFLCR